jgi:hypothetical protein
MPFSALSDFLKLGRIGASALEGNESLALELLEAANSEMLGYFRAAKPPIQEPFPASSVSTRMKEVECQLAAWNFMCSIGFDPTSKSDEIYLIGYEKSVKWLEGVAAGRIQPLPIVAGVVQDADTSSDSGSIVIESDSPRGW